MYNKRVKNKLFLISFIINIIIFLLVLAGTIVMMTVGSGALATNSLSVFKYFTFQSNIYMGIVALIYAYYQFLIIKKKKEKISHVLAIFNRVGVTAVTLTFLVVIAFLAPGYGYDKMYNNANLFFHLLVPVLAIINFVVFTKNEKCHFAHTLYPIIPCVLYGIVYLIVVVSLNAYGDLKIDFYNFGKDGPLMGVLNFLIIISFSYIIGVVLYLSSLFVFKKSK